MQIVFRLVVLSAFACMFGCETRMSYPDPQPLQAGVAEVRMPVPVGIGTAGFGPFNAPANPTPFSVLYPGTQRLHGHPRFKAVVISRGPGNEVVFLRSDTVGVFQQFRRAIALEVEQRLGRSIDDALIFGGTHTHSGPGRILDGDALLDYVTDNFFPEFYQNMVHAAADAIMNAYADLQPARIGNANATCAGAHADRRCEDGREYTNDRMPMLTVERNGQVDAVVLAYAVHGTMLNISQLTLSEDVSGSIEAHVQSDFDHPMLALFFNSWAADMSPQYADATAPKGIQPPGYDQLLVLGRLVADSVQAALPSVAWETDPVVYAEVHRIHIDRDHIGYKGDTFPFPYGGAFCGEAIVADCDGSTMIPDLDQDCVALPSDAYQLSQTEISAGRVGEMRILTYPGEPGTLLAEKLLNGLKDTPDGQNVMLFGYTQDYIGYSLLEDDWYNGGYEASGGLWGPLQGEYLLERAQAIFRRAVVSGRGLGPLKDEATVLPPFDIGAFAPYVPTPGIAVGSIVNDVKVDNTSTDVITFTVRGNDPWLGTPVATLVDDSGNPVLLPSGAKITSDSYAMWVDLNPSPSYKDMMVAPSRAFEWTFSLPASLPVKSVLPDLTGGTYGLSVSIPTGGDPMILQSGLFTVK